MSSAKSSLKRKMCAGISVVAVAAIFTGSVGASDSAQEPDPRRLSDAYRALMSSAQERVFLAESTIAGRLAYARSLGLNERFDRLSSNDKHLVLDREIEEGMSTDAVLLAWGDPDERSLLNDGHEQWLYEAATRPFMETGFTYWLFVRDGVLAGYHSELIDAPEFH